MMIVCMTVPIQMKSSGQQYSAFSQHVAYIVHRGFIQIRLL